MSATSCAACGAAISNAAGSCPVCGAELHGFVSAARAITGERGRAGKPGGRPGGGPPHGAKAGTKTGKKPAAKAGGTKAGAAKPGGAKGGAKPAASPSGGSRAATARGPRAGAARTAEARRREQARTGRRRPTPQIVDGPATLKGVLSPVTASGLRNVLTTTFRTYGAYAAVILPIVVVTASARLALGHYLAHSVDISAFSIAAPLTQAASFSSSGHVKVTTGGLITALVSLILVAWAAATIVHLITISVRDRRRATLRDLPKALRFFGWVAAAMLGTQLIQLAVAVAAVEIEGNADRIRLIAEIVIWLPLATIWAFATQKIVVEGRNAWAALAESVHLVRETGFWYVLAMILLGNIALTAVPVVGSIFGSAVILIQLMVAPVPVIFVTVMYFLLNGERAGLEAMQRVRRGR